MRRDGTSGRRKGYLIYRRVDICDPRDMALCCGDLVPVRERTEGTSSFRRLIAAVEFLGRKLEGLHEQCPPTSCPSTTSINDFPPCEVKRPSDVMHPSPVR